MFKRLLAQLALPVVILAIGLVGLVWLSAEDAPPQRVAQQPTPPLVQTIVLQPSVSNFQIRVSGNVVPRREVALSTDVAGLVISKGPAIEGGRHVRQGAPLLQIDPVRFELQVDELGAELQQAAADLERLVTEEEGTASLIQLVEREVEIAAAASKRIQALVARGVASDEEKETVERAELQARNTLRVLLNARQLFPIRRERLQAQLKLTELKKQRAQLNLDRSRIVAPFNGVITSVMVEQGDFVHAGDVLLTLDDTSAVDVECSLQMDDLYWLWNSKGASDEKNNGNPGPPEDPTESSLPKSLQETQTVIDEAPTSSSDVQGATEEFDDQDHSNLGGCLKFQQPRPR